jgi:hypothetical protein
MTSPTHRRRLRIRTAAQLLDGAEHTPYDWGPWRLDPQWYVLVRADPWYEIDLEKCTTSAHVLDWIMQINGKTWGDHATLAGLVRAFDDLLHPQSTLCSFGQSTHLTQPGIRRRVREAAADLPRHVLKEAA